MYAVYEVKLSRCRADGGRDTISREALVKANNENKSYLRPVLAALEEDMVRYPDVYNTNGAIKSRGMIFYTIEPV